MNKEESIKLYDQGKEAWNSWATQMLEKRKSLEEAGLWDSSTDDRNWDTETRDWHDQSSADFSDYQFDKDVDFSGCVFPGDAEFIGATFSGGAGFREATFSGGTGFREATFSDGAWFDKANFSHEAVFREAAFSGGAWFRGATFSGGAVFRRTTFSGGAVFDKATFSDETVFSGATFSSVGFRAATFSGVARFHMATFSGVSSFEQTEFSNEVTFNAIEVERAFSLANAKFRYVPDFVQAHFAEAPRLDEVMIEPRGFWFPFKRSVKRNGKADDAAKSPYSETSDKTPQSKPTKEKSARWRALKRLAIQGHDHSREQEFFKRELLARRGVEDKRWHLAYWFGWAYQIFADFGRSMLRPIFWFLTSTGLFTLLHFLQYVKIPKQPGEAAADVSFFGWVVQKVWAWRPTATEDAPLTCIVGPEHPGWAAFMLSVRKAFLFLGGGSTEKLNQIYACLYGVSTNQALNPGSYTPNIPNVVFGLELLQQLISAILIFLILLAIRNHFRIK